jgi:tetratricopeptide (TPR) repeat protein
MRKVASLIGSLLCVLLVAGAGRIAARAQAPAQPQYTREEAEAYNALYEAFRTGKLEEAVQAGEAFLAKFPNSVLAPRAKPILVLVYAQTNRFEKAFEMGREVLSADPNNFSILYVLALAAATASKGRDTRFDADGLTYATRALELAASGNSPPGVAPQMWEQQKSKALGSLHQAAGLFLYNKADYDPAIEHLKKAAELDPSDPVTFYLIGEALKLGKYAKLRESYDKLTPEEKVADAGKQLLQQVDAVVDEMIEMYARTVAISEANASFQALNQEARKLLESFYRYRHNDTTEGMEELIKKYKPSTQASAGSA